MKKLHLVNWLSLCAVIRVQVFDPMCGKRRGTSNIFMVSQVLAHFQHSLVPLKAVDYTYYDKVTVYLLVESFSNNLSSSF